MAGALEGKTVVVTGAATGVGRAIARLFAEEGANLVVADRDEGALDDLVEAMADDGAQATGFSCDLTDRLSIANLLAASSDAYDRLDILVNASRKVAHGDFMESDGGLLGDLFDANVRATLNLSQAAAKKMIAQADGPGGQRTLGAIVNVTSIAARRTLPELFHYSVVCAALDQMTRSMAVALAPYRIRVNAIALGSVMTASLREALRGHDDLRDDLTAVTPLGRIGEAREAADAALFFASPQSSFITGQILAVDGGRTMLDPLAKPAV